MADPTLRATIPVIAPPPPPALATAAPPESEYRSPEEHLYAMAEKYKVDPRIALSILRKESGGRQTGPDGKPLTSSAGAVGMFQLLPATAYGEFKLNPKDPFQNVEAGIRYLRKGMDSGDGTIQSLASYYHGGPDRKQWGPKTWQYAQEVEDDLRQQLAKGAPTTPAAKPAVAAPAQTAPATAPTTAPATAPGTKPAIKVKLPGDWATPEALAEAARTSRTAYDQANAPAGTPQTTETIAAAAGKAPPPPTWWEQSHGRSNLPPDIAAQYATLHKNDDSGSYGDMLKHSNAVEATVGAAQGLKHTYDPTTRTGRRNLAATTAAVVAAPLLIPAGAGIGLGALISAGVAGGAGGGEELGEQVWERMHAPADKPPEPYDPGAVADAFGEQAEADLSGHIIFGAGRQVGRTLAGPGIGKKVAGAFEAERTDWVKNLQTKIDELRGKRRQFNADVGGQNAAIRATERDALQKARAAAAAGTATAEEQALVKQWEGEYRTNQMVSQAEALEAARNEAERQFRAQGEQSYEQQHAQRVPAVPPSESALGRRVAELFEGPAHEVFNSAGREVDAAAEAMGNVDYTALQNEARRLLREEIIPGHQAMGNIHTPATPPEFHPELGLSVNAEELAAISSHPAMRTIRDILTAPSFGPASRLHRLKVKLAQATDFDSPVSSIFEGSKKRLFEVMRQTLRDPRYDRATAAYEAIRDAMTTGAGEDVAKFGRLQPSKIIQHVNMKDPETAGLLINTLIQHGGPEGQATASAVRDAWLDRHVLRGSLSDLRGRLTALHAEPDFLEMFFGNSPQRRVIRDAGVLLDQYDAFIAHADERAARTAASGAENTAAMKKLGAERAAGLGAEGAADVAAVKAQGEAALLDREQRIARARDARAALTREGRLKFDKEIAALGIEKRAAAEVTPMEARAMALGKLSERRLYHAARSLMAPGTWTATGGIIDMLKGPRAAELMKLIASRPELNDTFTKWIANPNTLRWYQLTKHSVGIEAEEHGVGPARRKAAAYFRAHPTPIVGVSPPPAPSER